MDSNKCANCNELKRCRDSYAYWIFFIIGLIATIGIRVVTVLMHINSIYGRIAWYIGMSGFFLFFMYKFNVNRASTKLIEQQDIVNKISQKQQLTDGDYKLISEIFCSLSSRKERINYFFIFGLSSLALIIAAYIDFFK